jgi:hypothetical protein
VIEQYRPAGLAAARYPMTFDSEYELEPSRFAGSLDASGV